MTTAGQLAPPRGVVVCANLLYFDQPDTAGLDWFLSRAETPDRELYVAWIRPRPDTNPDELRVRLALHVNHRER